MNNLEKTRFMNKATFSEKEIKKYPYGERRTFIVWLDDSIEPLKHYATDEQSLFEYLSELYYTESINSISEVITQYIELELPVWFNEVQQ